MNNYPFEKYFTVTKRLGSQLTGNSPFRDDENPSFSANSETGLWTDFGTNKSGNWDQFCELLNIFVRHDNPPPEDFWKNSIKVKEYIYFDENDAPQLKVERHENLKAGSKQFVQKHIENGQWKNGKASVAVTPYRYSEWKNKTEPIYWCEGEKCVEALFAIGLAATTTPGGSSAKIEAYQKYFQNRTIYIIPDNDEVGKKYANRVASMLLTTGKEVKIINLSGLNEGEDIVEWLANGGNADELINICKATAEFKNVGPEKGETNPLLFGPLGTLPQLLPKVPVLDDSEVPEPFRAWIKDVSDRMNVSREFILIPALVGLASLIGRRIAIKPKQHDSWYEVINLWGMIIGAPSVMKSPALSESLGFISQLNQKRINKFIFEKKAAEPKIEILKIKENSLAKALGKAVQDGTSVTDVENELKLIKEEIKNITPRLDRIIVNDTTVEKLCELLEENPNGLLLFRDELAGWLSNLTKNGREGDREFYLEAWSGKNPYDTDRIARGSRHVPALRIAILGGIQPSKLSLFMKDIANGGSNADGLFDRFQLAVYPERTEWKHIDRTENYDAKDRVYKIFELLLDVDFPAQNLELINGIPSLKFSIEAQKLFNDWIAKLEKRLRHPLVTDIPHFESHLGKYRSLMPKLAALIELISWADIQRIMKSPIISISEDSANNAIKLCDFLESHAKKIHAIAAEPGLFQAHALSKKISSNEINNSSTIREISRHHWRDLKNVTDVEIGLSVLEKYNWVKVQRANAGQAGRPSEVVLIHPDLRGN